MTNCLSHVYHKRKNNYLLIWTSVFSKCCLLLTTATTFFVSCFSLLLTTLQTTSGTPLRPTDPHCEPDAVVFSVHSLTLTYDVLFLMSVRLRGDF